MKKGNQFSFNVAMLQHKTKDKEKRKTTISQQSTFSYYLQRQSMLQGITANKDKNFTAMNIQFFPQMLLMMQHSPQTKKKGRKQFSHQQTFSFSLHLCQHCSTKGIRKKDHNNFHNNQYSFFPQILPMMQDKTVDEERKSNRNLHNNQHSLLFPPMLLMLKHKTTHKGKNLQLKTTDKE